MASVVVDGLTLPIPVGGHPALDFCNTRAGWGAPQSKEYLVSHAHLTLWAAENGLLDRTEVAPLRLLAVRASGAAQQVLDRALRFRDGLYDVLAGAGAPASWSAVNAEVAVATAALRLRPPAQCPSQEPRRSQALRDSSEVAVLGDRSGRNPSAGAGCGPGCGSAEAAGLSGPSGRNSDGVTAAGGRASWELVAGGGADRLALPLLAVAWSAAGLLTSIGPAAVAACPGTGCGWLFHDPRGRRRWCSMAWCGNRAKARRHAARTASH